MTRADDLAAELDRARAEARDLRARLALAEGERDEARRRHADTDRTLTVEVARVEALTEQVEALHSLTGCEREWTNLHDLGDCAVDGLGGVVEERDAALAHAEELTSALATLRAAVRTYLAAEDALDAAGVNARIEHANACATAEDALRALAPEVTRG